MRACCVTAWLLGRDVVDRVGLGRGWVGRGVGDRVVVGIG